VNIPLNNRRRVARGLAVAVILVLSTTWFSVASCSSVYVCPGKDGGSHFTNTPVSDECTVFSRKKKSPFGTDKSFKSGGKKVFRYSGFVPYDSQINHYGSRYRVDPNLIKAVIRTESDFNRYAVSSQGAQGLMQLMPETARELRVSDPFNPGQNIDGGTRYLRSLLDTFDGDLTLTLAAYNAGPTLVKRVNRIPRIPETVTYVQRVLAYYQGYRDGGAADAFGRSTIRVRDVVTIQ